MVSYWWESSKCDKNIVVLILIVVEDGLVQQTEKSYAWHGR